MAARADILELVSNSPTTNWSGVAFRHTNPQFNPLSAQGSRLAGGRWNPRGLFGAIYLAYPRDTCVREFARMALAQGSGPFGYFPRAFYEVGVPELSVLDLGGVEQQLKFGLTIELLGGKDWSHCQGIAECAHFLGFEGIVAPSATGSGIVIAVFDDRPGADRLSILSSELLQSG